MNERQALYDADGQHELGTAKDAPVEMGTHEKSPVMEREIMNPFHSDDRNKLGACNFHLSAKTIHLKHPWKPRPSCAKQLNRPSNTKLTCSAKSTSRVSS